MRVQPRSEQAELRCAYCHGSRGGELEPCLGCGTLLHAACRRELGACSTLGCSRAQGAELASARPSLLRASAAALCLAGGASAIQGLLLEHVRTPSDAIALSVHSAVVNVALGVWIAERSRGGHVEWSWLKPVALYVCGGWILATSSVHVGIWAVTGFALTLWVLWRLALEPYAP